MPDSSRTDRERARRARKNQIQRRRIASVAVTAAIVLFVIAFLTVSDSAIPKDVRIGGVDVSGMNYEQARAAVEPAVRERMASIIQFQAEEEPLGFRRYGSELASGPQFDRVFDEARTSRGRIGRMLSWVGIAPDRDIPLSFEIPPEAVDDVVSAAGPDLRTAPVSAQVRRQGSRLVVRPARPGHKIDRDELTAELELLPDIVDVPVAVDEPLVTTEDAEEVVALAERMRSKTRTVTYKDRSAPLTPAVVTKALIFGNRDDEIRIGLKGSVLRAALSKRLRLNERPPTNALWRLTGERAILIPAKAGRRFDTRAVATAIQEDPSIDRVRASIIVRQPDRTTDDARELKITERISSFSTPYDCCQDRVINIGRAAQILDGYILPAGETFSLNDALGERTIERGFVEAPAIEAGEITPSVGGGVSQVATTLFNAAFFGGLEIVSHQPHSFYFARYPEGREATVSWTEPDLVFRNNWDAAVLISVATANNGITISMYSTSFDRRVESTTSERSKIVEPETIERLDPDLEPGTEVVVQAMGSPGFSVSYTRTVYRGDTVVSDATFYWTYRPENEIIEKGPPKRKDDKKDRKKTPADGTDTAKGSGTATGPQGGTSTGPGGG